MDAESAMARRICQRVGAPGGGSEFQQVKALVRMVSQKYRMLGASEVEAAVLQQASTLLQRKTTTTAPAANKEQQKGRGEDDENAMDEEIDAEVFQQYACGQRLTFPCGRGPRTHPGDIAESGLLAAVPLPQLSYCLKAFDDCVERNVLSDLQLEGALHACQRHRATNRGVRSGFFLGDGAGVGKGRQVAGVIFDSVARGRPRHVWFSIASDLRLDAERDLKDVGCHVPVVNGCQSLDAAAKLAFGGSSSSSSSSSQKKRGVLFSTYSTLISAFQATSSSSSSSSSGGKNVDVEGKGKKKSRLDQLVDWCGGATFQGCLVFDEAHKAKNFDASNAEKSTKMSQAVIAIQEKLPLARVVYASATGVSEISNMAYASRLGLWGPGTPFESFAVFAETMDKRGVGALEMLALELKAGGAYVSRGLSWSHCEFDHVICELGKEAVEIYDQAAVWWRALKRAFHFASNVVEKAGVVSQRRGGPEKKKKKKKSPPMVVWQRFWGTQLRFFKELQTALKVPFVVAQAKEALRRGQSVVVGLQSTGEAGLAAAMQQTNSGDAVKDLVSAAKVAAKRFVLDFFPVNEPEEEEEEEAERFGEFDEYDVSNLARVLQVENRPPPDAARVQQFEAFLEQEKDPKKKSGRRPPIPELVAAREEALRALDRIDLPPSPLDKLVDELGGTSVVAEMTGRSARIARRSAGSALRYEKRDHTDSSTGSSSESSLNVRERQAFMDGKKTVAIISDAASTGVSLHAANGTKAAHRRRVHVTLELAWSADKSIQQLGRSHRANQATAPLYKLVTTDLGGENRFAAAVSRRLATLGALTKGDRRAASGQDLSDFDVDNKHGRQALAQLIAACTNAFNNNVALNVVPGAHPALLKALAKAKALAQAEGLALDDLDDDDDCDDDTYDHGGNLQETFAGFVAKSRRLLKRRRSVPEPATEGLPPSLATPADQRKALAILARRAFAELDMDAKKNDVRTFLNRLQALDVAAQNLLFEYFCACHKGVVANAKANGTYDAGVADVRANEAKVVKREVINVDAISGAETVLSEISLDRGCNWTDVAAKHDAALEAEHLTDDNPDDSRARLHASGLLLADTVLPEEDEDDDSDIMRDDDDDEAENDDDEAENDDDGAEDVVVVIGGTPRHRRKSSPAAAAAGSSRLSSTREKTTNSKTTGTTTTTTTPPRGDAEDSADDWAATQRARKWATGFYVSRRPLPSTKKHGVMLAVKKTGASNFVITRPNTGTSPYEMSFEDLRERYEAHPATSGDPAEKRRLRRAWTKQFEDADHAERGGRKTEMGMISGAVLPFWRALEATANENKMHMTKAEQALKVYRITLDDGDRLVGVRFPKEVLPALRVHLEAERENRVVSAEANVKVDPADPIDPSAFKAVRTTPRTIDTFFKPAAAKKRDAPETTKSLVEGTDDDDDVVDVTDDQPPKPSTTKKAKKIQEPNPKKKAAPQHQQQPPPPNPNPKKKTKLTEAAKKTRPISNFFKATVDTKKTRSPPDEEKKPTPAASFVACPCCGDFVESNLMDQHLDTCGL